MRESEIFILSNLRLEEVLDVFGATKIVGGVNLG